MTGRRLIVIKHCRRPLVFSSHLRNKIV
jgi:hypothetical protein